MRRLLLTAAALILLATTVTAQTQDDRHTMLALADFMSFAKYCPAHWERLSPDTMQMLVNMSKATTAKLGREAMTQAGKEAIARNSGKPKSWCDETFIVINGLPP